MAEEVDLISNPSDGEEDRQLDLQFSESEDEEGEMIWDPLLDLTVFVNVKRDKLSVEYIGRAGGPSDVGAVRANLPILRKQHLFYYEIKIVSAGERCNVVLGLADSSFRLNRQPGWQPNSYGYHGIDGRRYHDSTRGATYGPEFGVGDVVGCGVLYHKQEIFFTRNGQHLGTAFGNVDPRGLYPTVSLHAKGEQIRANFGRSPFSFDIDALIADERERRRKLQAAIPVDPSVMTSMVCSYLLTHGHSETLAALRPPGSHSAAHPGLDPLMNGEHSKEAMTRSLQLRSEMRKTIVGGHSLQALAKLKERYPVVFSGPQPVKAVHTLFALLLQHFLDLICVGPVDDAVLFAREELRPIYPYLTDCSTAELKDAMTLVAYPDTSTCPARHLLSINHRHTTADTVNVFILDQEGGVGSARSALERALGQLSVTHNALRLVRGSAGEMFDLEHFRSECGSME